VGQEEIGVAGDVERIFAAVDANLGRLDILVNNAAIYDPFDLQDAQPARVQASIQTNL
jgi:NAD(P)-dependent dehydrogenase (short-subunit alcohol dehydrogenase family)